MFQLADITINWPANTWIKVNAEQIGFYRVMYDTAGWNEIATALQNDHTVSQRMIL